MAMVDDYKGFDKEDLKRIEAIENIRLQRLGKTQGFTFDMFLIIALAAIITLGILFLPTGEDGSAVDRIIKGLRTPVSAEQN